MFKISVLDGFCWTDWVNLYPANEGKDIEIFTRFAALQHGLCLKPIAVDYLRADGKQVKEKLKCNFFGCRCVNSEQEPGIRCSDYKVRFLCKCKHDTAVENPTFDTFVCHNGDPRELRCKGSAIIKIKAAFYGNIWLSPCGLGSIESNCREEPSTTLERVALACNGRASCSVQLPDGDNGCRQKKALHIEYACEAIALAPGNYIGTTGEIYVDPTCKYKCIFLLSNRAVCLPVCPLHYGFACPPGNIVRWITQPDTFAKHCSCKKPICLDIDLRCKMGQKVYYRGERFHLGCEEECVCLGRNELKCFPLCTWPGVACAENQKQITSQQATRYSDCKCPITKCVENNIGVF
eukprot:gene98-9713_t